MNYEEILHEISSNCIAVRLKILNRTITSIYDKALKPYGIRVTQLNVVFAVSLLGPVEIRPLCALLSMDNSTMCRTLSRIEEKGWLISEPSGHGKNIIISITQSGKELLLSVYPAWKEAQVQAEALMGRELVLKLNDSVNTLMEKQRKKYSI